MRWRGLALGLVTLAGACGDAAGPADRTTAPAALPVIREAAIAYTPLLDLDVYRPDAAGPWPVVVLIPGGGWNSADLASTAPLAEDLAARGAVVFNATYRLTSPEIALTSRFRLRT